MHNLSPDLARLLVTQRHDEAEWRRRRRAARGATTPRVPQQQRRGRRLLGRVVPGAGVRADTR